MQSAPRSLGLQRERFVERRERFGNTCHGIQQIAAQKPGIEIRRSLRHKLVADSQSLVRPVKLLQRGGRAVKRHAVIGIAFERLVEILVSRGLLAARGQDRPAIVPGGGVAGVGGGERVVSLERLLAAVEAAQNCRFGGQRGGRLEGKQRIVCRDGIVKPPRPLHQPCACFDRIRIIRFQRQRPVVERKSRGVLTKIDVNQAGQIASETIGTGNFRASGEAFQRFLVTAGLQQRQRLPKNLLNVRLRKAGRFPSQAVSHRAPGNSLLARINRSSLAWGLPHRPCSTASER